MKKYVSSFSLEKTSLFYRWGTFIQITASKQWKSSNQPRYRFHLKWTYISTVSDSGLVIIQIKYIRIWIIRIKMHYFHRISFLNFPWEFFEFEINKCLVGLHILDWNSVFKILNHFSGYAIESSKRKLIKLERSYSRVNECFIFSFWLRIPFNATQI